MFCYSVRTENIIAIKSVAVNVPRVTYRKSTGNQSELL